MQAIQERRRSALRDMDSHSFFTGGVPGMSPSKKSTSPTKPGFHDANNPFLPISPTKKDTTKDPERRLSVDEEDEKLDTRSLLERMKETVEGMKRRRSTIGMPGSSPVKPLPGLNLPEETMYAPLTGALWERSDAMDVDQPSLLRSPDRSLTPRAIQEDETEIPPEFANESTPTTPVAVESLTTEESPAQEELLQPEPVCLRVHS